MADVVKLLVANGALLTVPIWEPHERGDNWLAIIDIDPTKPGGLERQFVNKGRGECHYVTEPLKLFDAVQFAADYTTGMGKKRFHRWFGVVVAKTEDYILLEHCVSGAMAVLRAKEARMSSNDRAAALRAEKTVLEERAAKLAAEIEELEQRPDEKSA